MQTCDPVMGIGQAITIPLFFASNVPLSGLMPVPLRVLS
jgi:hypothetical protein